MSRNHLHTFVVSVMLTAAVSGCATPPGNLDLSLDKHSASGRYAVALVPPSVAPKINQLHSWTVRLSDTAGSPVTGATLAVGGGMPQHGHGFPTKPRVTREVEDGTYLLEGMKFSMPGWWNITFDILGSQGEDKVIFNTVVAPAAAR